MSGSQRILVKLRTAPGFGAAARAANLRPLHAAPARAAQGLAPGPAWYLADLPADAATPWDAAHARIADRLGVDASAVEYAEPDLANEWRWEADDEVAAFAIGEGCAEKAKPQSAKGGRKKGPSDGWHLAKSQLLEARAQVAFSEPRTRIAHIDTGYERNRIGEPAHVEHALGRSFVDGDGNPGSAEDPDTGFFDNTGHGTGTIGILAGAALPQLGDVELGGAPGASVLPLRISNRVVLLWTSVFAQALRYAVQQRCDVVSLSMGGLPSRAWSEEVDAAYEAGVCIVAAAGNNVGKAPTRHLVYPARYRQTIAACGVMFGEVPYTDLGLGVLEGNFGPQSRMGHALAAYTPNVPWPVFGCRDTVRMNGEGTSSATPQIAAAAALWFEKHKTLLPRTWRRVEAVRKALFDSASATDPEHFGNGVLRARRALDVAPVLDLPRTPADDDSFAFLRVLTGLGVDAVPPREHMFNLEITQLWMRSPSLQSIVPDPHDATSLSEADQKRFLDALIAEQEASLALRRHAAKRYALVTGAAPKPAPKEIVPEAPNACDPSVVAPLPRFRRLRTYAVDPSLSTRLATAAMNDVTLKLRWESLEPGPKGEYLDVVGTDASGAEYPPLDLNDPKLLAQDGHAPSEGNAGFHQQMVYAVAMKTIEHFETALGRPVLWRPRIDPENEHDDSRFERRLCVRPHPLHEANAYYSPQDVGLRFGYFAASADAPGDHVPGSFVYTCLSHDIIAHETTHAILDGMHRRFNEPSNPDVLAMHEAFADIVALMQHFTIPEILHNEIERTRGRLETESILGSLAIQFGRALGGRSALRSAIGTVDAKGVWRRIPADPTAYQRVTAPHARGSLLVAAVFDAFLAIYHARTADLLRIYTGGTGVLPDGAIHPDLVRRLAEEAAKTAQHVLNMCIRALDYIPPVDITFGEYLRGIVTADYDLVDDDQYGYRIAFVEAFRRRGLYPRSLRTLSVETLRWHGADLDVRDAAYEPVLDDLKRYADACFYIDDRRRLFRTSRRHRASLQKALKRVLSRTQGLAAKLGLDPEQPSFEVHELRRSIRLSPEGRHVPQVVVGLVQSRRIEIGDSRRHLFRGGSTLVIDLGMPAVKYSIYKNVLSPSREQLTREYLERTLADPLRALLAPAEHREPFAVLHALAEEPDGR